MDKPLNPFFTGTYLNGDYFCDRELETCRLRENVDNGRNTVLYAPRRMGKTELIKHFFNQPEVKEKYLCFYFDAMSTTSLQLFVYRLSRTLFDQGLRVQRSWPDKFLRAITALRVGFSYDEKTNMPELGLTIQDVKDPDYTLGQLFKFLNQQKKTCILAIDEFQQVASFKDASAEAVIRGYVQDSPNVRLIYSGSEQHLLAQMFSGPNRPFYQSAEYLRLNPIPLDVYQHFAQEIFEDYGKILPRECFSAIYQKFEGCTWYVQTILNRLFAITKIGQKATRDDVEAANRIAILDRENTFSELLSSLKPAQVALLEAIAREGVARQITSGDFILKHGLVSASSVQNATKALIANQCIVKSKNEYRVYDYFLAEWLRSPMTV